MKQILSKTFFALLLLVIVCSCKGPQGKCLDEYEDFVEMVEEDADDYSFDDWKYAYEQYNEFESELDEYRRDGSLDREDRLRANELKRRFNKVFPVSARNFLKTIGGLVRGDDSDDSLVKDIIDEIF